MLEYIYIGYYTKGKLSGGGQAKIGMFSAVAAGVFCLLLRGNTEDYDNANWQRFMYAWWLVNIKNEDLLHQKVALALSKIMVISKNSNLSSYVWDSAIIMMF